MAGQKGIAHILVLVILVAGLGALLYLSQQTQIFKPRADEPISAPITKTTTSPTCVIVGSFLLETDQPGIWQARTLDGYVITCGRDQCFWEVDQDGQILASDSGLNNFTYTPKDQGRYTVNFGDPGRNYSCSKTVTVKPSRGPFASTPTPLPGPFASTPAPPQGPFKSYIISGTVYKDADGDGFRSEDEEGYVGAAVLMTGQPTVTTDENGYYRFRYIQPGVYSIEVKNLPVTSENPVAVEVPPSHTIEFGIAVPTTIYATPN